MNTVASLPAKLPPCPFCGSADNLLPTSNGHDNAYIECANCGANDHEPAAWNRRALASPAPSVEATPNPLARYWMNRAEFWMQTAISLGWREVRDTANGEAPSVSPAVGVGLPEVVELADRAEELAERLVASGPKAAHVSASETHELSEWVFAAAPLIRRLATTEQPGSAVQGEMVARAIAAVKESELFEDGVEADLASAGITTIAGAFMEGRMAAISELEMELEGQSVAATTPPPAPFADMNTLAGSPEWRARMKATPPAPAADPVFHRSAQQLHSVEPAAEQGDALAAFTDYFVRNYPGPDTVIMDPRWHASRIFRAAQYAISAATQPEARGVEGMRNALEEIATVAHSDQSESDLETVLAWLASIVDPLLATTNPVRAEQPEGKGA